MYYIKRFNVFSCGYISNEAEYTLIRINSNLFIFDYNYTGNRLLFDSMIECNKTIKDIEMYFYNLGRNKVYCFICKD